MSDEPDYRGAESNRMARWQGRVDSQLQEQLRRLDGLNGDLRRSADDVEAIRLEMASLRAELAVIRTKVAFWSGLGGLVGAGVVSAIVAIATQVGP